MKQKFKNIRINTAKLLEKNKKKNETDKSAWSWIWQEIQICHTGQRTEQTFFQRRPTNGQ